MISYYFFHISSASCHAKKGVIAMIIFLIFSFLSGCLQCAAKGIFLFECFSPMLLLIKKKIDFQSILQVRFYFYTVLGARSILFTFLVKDLKHKEKLRSLKFFTSQHFPTLPFTLSSSYCYSCYLGSTSPVIGLNLPTNVLPDYACYQNPNV